jgi:hypothetical protein
VTTPLIGTIVGRNYVPFARVLAQSLQRHHPDVQLVVLAADDIDGEDSASLAAGALGVPDLNGLRFRCTRQELVVTLKPFLLATLLERQQSALFLDADSLVLAPLDQLFAAVRAHAVTLVPHRLEPPSTPDRVERDLALNLSGVFNGGVVGVSRTPQTLAFLEWWCTRVYSRCRHDIARGMLFDQRWLDLVPGFVEDLHVHRDPGVNVAHWNLTERPIQIRNSAVTAGGVLCRLFHFSGFDADDPETPIRHRPELHLEALGDAAQLYRHYAAALYAAGWRDTRARPYAFDSFSNGVRIPLAARRAYAELADRERFGDPFDADGTPSFFEWLREGSPSPLWLSVHRERADVQLAYPDPEGADRRRFRAWARKHGRHEHGIPAELVG